MFRRKQVVRHLKTRGVYRIVHTPEHCFIEATGEPAYAYQFLFLPGAPAERRGRIWVRSQREMEDGRFEPVA